MGTYCVNILAYKSMLDEWHGKHIFPGINEALIRILFRRIDIKLLIMLLAVSHCQNSWLRCAPDIIPGARHHGVSMQPYISSCCSFSFPLQRHTAFSVLQRPPFTRHGHVSY